MKKRQSLFFIGATGNEFRRFNQMAVQLEYDKKLFRNFDDIAIIQFEYGERCYIEVSYNAFGLKYDKTEEQNKLKVDIYDLTNFKLKKTFYLKAVRNDDDYFVYILNEDGKKVVFSNPILMSDPGFFEDSIFENFELDLKFQDKISLEVFETFKKTKQIFMPNLYDNDKNGDDE